MSLNIGSNEHTKPSFELVLQVRNKQGEITGKTKSFSTDNSSDLERFFVRNSSVVKKNKKNIKVAQTKDEINQALKEVTKHTEKIRKQKGLED